MVINEQDNNEVILKYTGKVVSGNKIGRTINIPTVNIPIIDDIDLPAFGVYVARLSYIEETQRGNMVIIHTGVANIGVKPSIPNPNGSNPVGIEVNLFDFTGNLYDKEVTVELLHYVRTEMKFETIEQLRLQIEQDIQTTREFLSQCDEKQENS